MARVLLIGWRRYCKTGLINSDLKCWKKHFKYQNTLETGIENIVKGGYLQDNTETFNKALKLLISRYKSIKIGKDIDKLRVKAGRDINLTEEVMKTHEVGGEL